MIDILDDPLSLEDGRSVQWDVFEGQFLSLYRDILRRKGDARQNAIEIVGLCRAAVGGFARKGDSASLRRVIQYYTSRADIIHSAGAFTDVADFSIVHYPSIDEKQRLQEEVLPRIAPRVDTEGVVAKEVEPAPVQIASSVAVETPAISPQPAQQETVSSPERPAETLPRTISRADTQEDLVRKAEPASVQVAPVTVDSPYISPPPAEQEAVSAEQRAAVSVKPNRELVPSPRPGRLLLLRAFFRDAVGRCREKTMSLLSVRREGYWAAVGMVVRGLFGNLGRQPSDLASRLNRRRTRRRMGRKVGN